MLTELSKHESTPLLPPNESNKPQIVVVDMQFYINVAKMTVMWTGSSFGYFTLNFMNKYFEGNMYQNNYIDGCAGLLSCMIGSQIYAFFGKKSCFLFAYSMALIGGILVLLL